VGCGRHCHSGSAWISAVQGAERRQDADDDEQSRLVRVAEPRTIAASTAARVSRIAHPDCTMLIALLRCAGGHVSLTSTAPDAHSPPMPMPSTERQNRSCSTLCDVAAPSDANENTAIVPMSARVRSKRSATQPKISPPSPETTSGAVPRKPAIASPNSK
jgi:hypothetical protein